MKIYKIILIIFFVIVLISGVSLWVFFNKNYKHSFDVRVYDLETKKPVPYATVIFSYSRGWSGSCADKKYFTSDKDGIVIFKSTNDFCMNEAYAPGYKRGGKKDVVSSEIYLEADPDSSFSKIQLK